VCTSFGFGDRAWVGATVGHFFGGAGLAALWARMSLRVRAAVGARDVAHGPQPRRTCWRPPRGARLRGLDARGGRRRRSPEAPRDIDACLAAGFSMFTIDPGEHVGDVPPQASEPTCAPRPRRCRGTCSRTARRRSRALRRPHVRRGDPPRHLHEHMLLQAAVKYGPRHRARDHDVSASWPAQPPAALRVRDLGGRNRRPDVGGRALLRGEGVRRPRLKWRQASAAPRGPLREGR